MGRLIDVSSFHPTPRPTADDVVRLRIRGPFVNRFTGAPVVNIEHPMSSVQIDGGHGDPWLAIHAIKIQQTAIDYEMYFPGRLLKDANQVTVHFDADGIIPICVQFELVDVEALNDYLASAK